MSSCVGSSSDSNPKNMILLVSSDNERFEVEEAVVLVSQTIKNMIEDINCSDTPIPLPNVTSKVLSKVIEFCRRHHDADDTSDTDLQEFDKEFLNVEQGMLFDLILAANYLDIKSLLDTTCKCVADMIKGKTPEEIRKHFHIKNDYTPEEEAEVRQENAWAFE